VLIGCKNAYLWMPLGGSAQSWCSPERKTSIFVSPISQALTRDARPDDPGYSLIPLTILALFVIRVAQACLTFTGTSRLPMVAG
jgi:hypothetical protein